MQTKSISQKQLDANRRNALLSTGPATPEGHAVSKMNALKHGIFSREALLHGLNFNESEDELEALHKRFWDQFNPVGPVEEMLVDQIVTSHWRLRRVLTAESGEITLSVDTGAQKRDETKSPWDKFKMSDYSLRQLENSLQGWNALELLLGEVRKAVEQDGELTENTIKGLVKSFGGLPNNVTRRLDELRLKLRENQEGLEPVALRERNKNQTLDYLDQQLKSISLSKASYEERKKGDEESRQAAAALPPVEVLYKIIRYESMLQKQLYRAMSQLERVQRMGQGEAVPPPLTVEVSEKE